MSLDYRSAPDRRRPELSSLQWSRRPNQRFAPNARRPTPNAGRTWSGRNWYPRSRSAAELSIAPVTCDLSASETCPLARGARVNGRRLRVGRASPFASTHKTVSSKQTRGEHGCRNHGCRNHDCRNQTCPLPRPDGVDERTDHIASTQKEKLTPYVGFCRTGRSKPASVHAKYLDHYFWFGS